jgi:hypothetical protein
MPVEKNEFTWQPYNMILKIEAILALKKIGMHVPCDISIRP